MYALVHLISILYVHSWYRVRVTGQPFPPTGPLIICGNHTAGLMDAALLLQSAPRTVRLLAKYTVFRSPIVGPLARGARAIPIYRKKDNVPTEQNVASFQAVYESLQAGGAVVVFPEGESGTATHLRLPLKTGLARMALGAMDHPDGGDTQVHILPVGIFYEDRDRFRSRLEMCVGEPFPVGGHLPAFKENPRQAVPALMQEVESALRNIGPDLQHDQDQAVVKLARGIWRDADGQHLIALGQLTRRLNSEREQQPATCDARRERAEELLGLCRQAGLTPEEASHPAPGFLWGALLAPLLLVCVLVWAAPVLLARLAARRFAPADKFTTVAGLAAPLLGTLLAFAGALALALNGHVWLALALVPGSWFLLAGGVLALDAWRHTVTCLRLRRNSELKRQLSAFITDLAQSATI